MPVFPLPIQVIVGGQATLLLFVIMNNRLDENFVE